MAAGDRSYDTSWHPVTERTINRGTRRPMVRSIVGGNDRSHDQSSHCATDRMSNRCYLRPIVRSIVAPHDFESQVRSFEHDHPPCYDWFCPCDHPRSHTTSATSRTTSATSRTFFIERRFVHDTNMFQSQVWRNLVGSPEADSVIPLVTITLHERLGNVRQCFDMFM